MNEPWSIFIGYDAREHAAFDVCRASIAARLSAPIKIGGLLLDDLRARGLYTRPTEVRIDDKGNEVVWDLISDAAVSTEFSNSRFLVPHLAREGRKLGERAGWALFMDCDILVLENLVRLFEMADPKYAVMCVKHRHAPPPGTKMDGQLQQVYSRKNWSSFCLFNADHEANHALTVEMVNSVPGRDLHRFCWLKDEEIGELSPEWNWLVGHNGPKCLHWTEGGPWFEKYRDAPFADQWFRERDRVVTGRAPE